MRKASWLAVLGVMLLAACAPKAPPAVVGAPKHPEFVFPAAPEGTPVEQASRLDRGWQYLQLDDLRNAEREFAAALKQQAGFHPADAALGYVALARGNETDALARFERAVAADASYLPALIGRGQTLLELDRVGDALVSFETALAKDPTLTDLKSRVDVLRFRATQDMLTRAKTASDARRWDEAKAAYSRPLPPRPTPRSCTANWRWSSSGPTTTSARSITIGRPLNLMPAMRDRGPRLVASWRPMATWSRRCRRTSAPARSTSARCPTT